MPPNDPGAGSRFDSIVGNYGVLYCATDPTGCYGEVLARFRVDPGLGSLVRQDWDDNGWMRVGNLPRDWHNTRCLVQVAISAGAPPFLDIEHPDSRAHVEAQLRVPLTAFGVKHLDVPQIRGEDRRVTRLISQWAWHATDQDGAPLYSGVRYLSKVDTDMECWAVFDDVEYVELRRQRVDRADQHLQRILRRFELTLH